MIYDAVPPGAPLDQGDLIDECPVVIISAFTPGQALPPEPLFDFRRVVVVTQT